MKTVNRIGNRVKATHTMRLEEISGMEIRRIKRFRHLPALRHALKVELSLSCQEHPILS
ncbi:MAG: hypothetical protein IH628_16830 [Proteobacteria bacterium]|nr:hypothetical protein [Pseudomonadota bacterium]